MASAAEQLAANLNFSAFGKAEELKKRIWFTLGALIVYRLGTYIPLAGHRSRRLRRQLSRQAAGRARTVQHVRGRRRAAHGDLRAEHHALYFGLDHHPAAELGDSLARSAQEGRRAGPQGHQPVHALPDRRARRLPGLWHRGRPRGPVQCRQRSRLVLPHLDRADADGRHDVPDVARRADHLARHRQRLVADHFRRHRRGLPVGHRQYAGAVAPGRDLAARAAGADPDVVRRHRLHRLHGARAAPAADHLSQAPAGQPRL